MDPSTTAKIIEQGGKFAGDFLRLMISRPVKKKAESAATEYPEQMKTLKKLGAHNVVSLQDNGDAFVNAQDKLYLVTTAGNVFEQVEQPTAAPVVAGSVTHVVPKQVRDATNLPTRDETTTELKRRLSRELYKAELDLIAGLRIANKPCDCLDSKHSLEIEAAAEEMISQDPGNPVYGEIVQWIKNNLDKVSVQAIKSGQYQKEYPRMASDFKNFRKRVMGTAADSLTEPQVAPHGTGKITLQDAKKMAAEEAAKEVERAWNMEG